MTTRTMSEEKPTLRGVSHQMAAFAAAGAAAVLVALAPSLRAAWACAIYGLSLTAMFTISASYHRPNWSPRPRAWMRRLDHAGIFLLIAGTYTPFCLLALPPEQGGRLLGLVWTGAGLGIVKSVFWVDSPKPLTAALCVGLGWLVLMYWGDMLRTLGPGAMSLLAAGGVAYSAGAVAYASRRPNPLPGVFGYHEVFHALVILAAILQFASVVAAVRVSAQ